MQSVLMQEPVDIFMKQQILIKGNYQTMRNCFTNQFLPNKYLMFNEISL